MTRIVAFAILLLASFWTLAQEAAPDAVDLSEETVQALRVRSVAPVYPPLARQARIQGTVILKIVINKDGDVRDVRLVSGHPMLAPAAVEAVKQWKYHPYTKDGEVVEVSTKVRVNFSMPGEPAPAGTVGDAPGGGNGGYVVGGVISGIETPAGYERVPEAKMRPLRIQKIDPVYPPLAIQARLQGLVVLDLTIGAAGDVENVRLVSGHPMLAPSAVEAAKQWKYTPYVKDGNAIAVVTGVRLSYTLSETGSGVVSELAPQQLTFPQRVRISSGVSQGLLVTKVAPEYPEEARQVRIQGTVILHVRIDKEGNVATAELISGHPMLAPAAIEAVRQWKYRPYLLSGRPVEVDTQVQVNFVLQ